MARQARARGKLPTTIAARVDFEAVSHRFGEREVIRDVTLGVAPGEVMCLIGRSGCGKTTLLRLAAGLERPAAGRILINGRVVAGEGVFVPPERRGVGLMFQDVALPHLTALQNVMFGLRDMPRAEAEAEARRALGHVGLDDGAAAYPHMLSGGQQQRVALARAVVPRPGVLLMDEPFSGLDQRLRDEVREQTLAVLRDSRVTAVIVTHEPEEALRMADRIALMRAGRIVQVETPDAIYHRPADLFAAQFFSELNELPGTVTNRRIATALGHFDAPGLAEGTRAVVAIRPQGIRLRPAGLCIPARLERRRSLGEVELCDIAVRGVDRPLIARVRERVTALPRTEIGIEVDPAEVLVFAASEA